MSYLIAYACTVPVAAIVLAGFMHRHQDRSITANEAIGFWIGFSLLWPLALLMFPLAFLAERIESMFIALGRWLGGRG